MRLQCDRCDAVIEHQQKLLGRIKELEAEKNTVMKKHDENVVLMKVFQDLMKKADVRIEGLEAEIKERKRWLGERDERCGELIGKVADFQEREAALVAEIAGYKEINGIQKTFLEAAEKSEAALVSALSSLRNEAKGFLSMANPYNHGNTNIACLQNRIDEAEAALKSHKGGA